jgi:hypothetical protein
MLLYILTLYAVRTPYVAPEFFNDLVNEMEIYLVGRLYADPLAAGIV